MAATKKIALGGYIVSKNQQDIKKSALSGYMLSLNRKLIKRSATAGFIYSKLIYLHSIALAGRINLPLIATPQYTTNTEGIYGSDDIYPQLPGLTYEVLKTPIWSTAIHQSVSGKEVRGAFWTYPRWKFTLKYELLRDYAVNNVNEYKTLLGFFLKRQGAFTNFYFQDTDDHTLTDQLVGTGDGTNKNFQIYRDMGGFREPIQNIAAGSLVVKISNTATTAYTLSDSGTIVFTNTPSNGAQVTVSCEFYYRCRFATDSSDFSKFMHQLWENKQVELVSLK